MSAEASCEQPTTSKAADQTPIPSSPWLPIIKEHMEKNDIDGQLEAFSQINERDFHQVLLSLATEGHEEYIEQAFDWAERYHPRSVLIWYYRIRRSICKSKDKEVPLTLFERCKDLLGDDGLQVWVIVYGFLALFFDDTRVEEFLHRAVESPYPTVAKNMRVHLLDVTIQSKAPAVARQTFERLADEPNIEAFYMRMVLFEKESQNVDVPNCRNALNKLCHYFNTEKNWIEYLKFERSLGDKNGLESLIVRMREFLGPDEASRLLVQFTREVSGRH